MKLRNFACNKYVDRAREKRLFGTPASLEYPFRMHNLLLRSYS